MQNRRRTFTSPSLNIWKSERRRRLGEACGPQSLAIRVGLSLLKGKPPIYGCLVGQVILAVKPHAAALSNERLDLHCSQCFGEGNHASLKRCTKCQAVYYCDSVRGFNFFGILAYTLKDLPKRRLASA
jgi:hypothetical protein